MKTKSVYITSKETSVGRLVIVMGMMEILKGQLRNVAFFRPIIETQDHKDGDIDFVLNHFELQQSYEDAYAFTTEEAEKMFADGKTHAFFESLIEKYKKLEEKYDFVLCEGVHNSAFTDLIDFDINLDIAKNFSSPLMSVLGCQNKSLIEVEEEARIWNAVLVEENCCRFALFLNRIDPDLQEELQKKKFTSQFDLPVYLLPEIPELDRPTVKDIMEALDGQMLLGECNETNRIVWQSKVAAMTLDNVLTHLEDGDLIITPGDRSDILLGMLSANYAKNYPSIAGVVLTGGIKPVPSVLKLLQGLQECVLPYISVQDDTFCTTMRVKNVRSRIGIHSKRKIALAMGVFNKCVDTKDIENKMLSTRSSILTPAMFEYRLFEKARQDRKNIVLPESGDERILRAAEILLRREVVDITLLGDEDEIRLKSGAMGLDLSRAKVINPKHSDKLEHFAKQYYELRKHKGIIYQNALDLVTSVTYFATMMIYNGDADGMVSGATHTTRETIKPALETIKTKEGITTVSSVFFMCLDTRVLIYGDCAVNPHPTPEQLAQIAISSADTSMQFGIEPRVAMLSYSSGDSGIGEEVEMVRKANKIAREMRPDLMIEGPMQYDTAIDPAVGKKKMPNSKVAGNATVFIFPDLNTGNNTYKAVQRSAGAVAIGPVLQGLKKPINDLSRGCLVEDIVNTVAITAIQAQEGGQK